LPQAPTQPTDDPAFAPPAKVELPGMQEDPPAPFALAPGDLLRIRITTVDPVEAKEAQVDAAGRIHVPLVGDVEVLGLGLTEAEQRVEAIVRQRDRFAQVSIEVTSAAGHKATVIGAVNHPGDYEIRPNARVAQILALAGGMKTHDEPGEAYEQADVDAARLIRDGVALPISVSHAMQGEKLHNIQVRAGDILFVPSTRGQRVIVLGDVNSPKAVPFRHGMRLTEALALGGGFNKDADKADVRVIRGSLASPRVYRANVRALVGGSAGDVELVAGDIVFVTEDWYATVTDVINRLSPSLAAVVVTATILKK
jgi:polysaccharide export outer membrane protein